MSYKKLVQWVTFGFVVIYILSIYCAVDISINNRTKDPPQVPEVPQWVSWVGLNMFTILSAFTATVLGISQLIGNNGTHKPFGVRFNKVAEETGLTWVHHFGVISHLIILAVCAGTYFWIGDNNCAALVTSIGKSALGVLLAIVASYFVASAVAKQIR